MEKIPTQQAEKPSEAVIERVYNNNELSDGHTENIEHARDNGLITATEAGGKLFVKFLDIKNSALLPDKLYHVRHPRDAGAVTENGLSGEFYVQTQKMEVEPEGISVFDYDVEPAVFIFEPDANSDYAITLDPECFGGIPDEYMNAFIVHNTGTVALRRATQSVQELRRSAN